MTKEVFSVRIDKTSLEKIREIAKVERTKPTHVVDNAIMNFLKTKDSMGGSLRHTYRRPSLKFKLKYKMLKCEKCGAEYSEKIGFCPQCKTNKKRES